MPEIKCYSEIQVWKLAEEGYEWAIRGEIKADFLLEREKPQLSGFSLMMASHWPPKGSPAAHVCGMKKLRLRLVLVEPSSARRILKRRTRIYASHVRRWLLS